MEQEEVINFRLKLLQDNAKTVFEVYKQLEYKSYINITVSIFLFAAALSVINKVDSSQKIVMTIVTIQIIIIFLATVSVFIFSFGALVRFRMDDFVYYHSINLSSISDPLLLKKSLLDETLKKYEGLVEIHNYKNKYVRYGTFLIFIELGIMLVMLALLTIIQIIPSHLLGT